MITASTDVDRFIIPLGTLLAVVKSAETNSHMNHITSDNDNYHDYRLRLFDRANERNRIRWRYSVNWVRWAAREATIDETHHLRWGQLLWPDASTIRFTQWQKPDTTVILCWTPFLQVNCVRWSAREATMDETCRQQWRGLTTVQYLTLSTRQIENHSNKSIERDSQSENQSMVRSHARIGNTKNRRWSRERNAS